MRIETDRLVIRPYRLEDARHLFETLNDEEVLKYIPEEKIRMQQAVDAVKWLISNYKIDCNSDYKYSFAIELKEENIYVGWCGVGYLDFNREEKEIYYTLKSDYWGKGYATEAVKALIDYIFKKLHLEKIVAVVKPDNMGSKKVIEKLGFNYGGIVENLPQEFKFYEGELLYTLNRKEY